MRQRGAVNSMERREGEVWRGNRQSSPLRVERSGSSRRRRPKEGNGRFSSLASLASGKRSCLTGGEPGGETARAVNGNERREGECEGEPSGFPSPRRAKRSQPPAAQFQTSRAGRSPVTMPGTESSTACRTRAMPASSGSSTVQPAACRCPPPPSLAQMAAASAWLPVRTLTL